MSWNLQDSVVRITSSNPDIANFGTGFAIHRYEQATCILTCAHVVYKVGGENSVMVEGMKAIVVGCGWKDGIDLAVLQVEGLLGKSLLSLKPAGEKDKPVRTEGYQSYVDGQYLRRPLRGVLGEQVGIGKISAKSNKLISAWDLIITDAYQLQPGYSGSPVVDENGDVIGVVNARQEQGKKGLAISIEALKDIWSEMPSSLLKEAKPAKRQETTATHSVVYRGHISPVCKIAWSPNSNYIATVSREETVRIWNDETGMLYRTYNDHRGAVNTVAWSPDNTCIVSGDANGIIYLWDTTTGELRSNLRSHTADAVYDVAWSPASCIAVARASNKVQIYNPYLHECASPYTSHLHGIGNFNGVLKVAWSPDGTRIASSGWDRTVWVWEPMTGTTICSYHDHKDKIINDLSWSPDSTRLATAGSDGTIQVWDARIGNTLLTCRMPLNHYVTGVCWSPDGAYLASGGADGIFQIRDATSGNTLLEYCITKDRALRAIAWSPDGRRLAVACTNGDVQIWSISVHPEIKLDQKSKQIN